ncbi:MAG: multicopper oxidase family protein [Balneola sp.]|nr:multicopper oxidase family protein [Balneola sp.]MBO6649495.1 multicopper oxidase family protein [Balneola sp.]MBO6711311.1 multicopper oxidase family protein [Balneola sp.]MBO6800574.1 multicopper oxidase family protein [Balneola sp.]MBO6869247.1 multicopper oxidase family protein [Balneola sp.]
MNRRRFIRNIAMGSGALALSSLISSCRTNQMNGYDEFINTLEQPPLINNQNFTLAASSENYSIGENYQISGFQFNQSYPSPTIKCQHGDRIKAIFENQIGQDSIIHWHGLIVPPDMDGHPKDAISGGAYEYDFLINQRAGTYWYHPHPDRITGDQVYKGLAGFFIVEDEEEKALDLPNGEFEIPLLIQDRRSTSSGEIVYDPSMHEQMMTGFLGDKVLINGTPAAFKDVKKGRYRVRLLNGSNARIYNIAFQNQLPFTLIGGDGGLLPKALEVDQLLLAPGERADILIDFSKFSQERASLVSLPFDIPSSGGMMNGMGNMMGGSSPEQGASFKLMEFKIIDERVGSIPELPKELSVSTFPEEKDAALRRQIDLNMQMMKGHTINGKQFEMNRVDLQVKQGQIEIWEFINDTPTPHPMHIHAIQFKVLDRSGSRGILPHETGWKDTVLVMPGEHVRVIMKFDAPKGMYVFHCHNLEHEDSGMMANYEIT